MPEFTVRNPECGCPYLDWNRKCFQCRDPGQVQTRILYPPTKCVKTPCGFLIPSVPCNDREAKPYPLVRHSYDLTVDEPGPNDSYGLNGLNWWDWKMEEYNKKMFKPPAKNTSVPDHPYLSKQALPTSFPNLMCTLPVECYSRNPEPACETPFKQPVNYTRDWRCKTELAPPPWKPPTVAWATNQHL